MQHILNTIYRITSHLDYVFLRGNVKQDVDIILQE